MPGLHSTHVTALRSTLWATLIVAVVSTLCACGTTRRAIVPSPVATPVLAPIERGDYEILGDVQGYECVDYTGLWPIPLYWTSTKTGVLALFSFDTRTPAREIALHKAQRRVPHADMLLAPRITETHTVTAFWGAQTCVKVVAKPIVITGVDGEAPAVAEPPQPAGPAAAKLPQPAYVAPVPTGARSVNGCQLEPATECSGRDLSGGDFRQAKLRGANFSNSDLAGAWFAGADLRKANLSDSNISDADFTGADLTGAKLGGARRVGVTWSNTTCPDGTNSDEAGDSGCSRHMSR